MNPLPIDEDAERVAFEAWVASRFQPEDVSLDRSFMPPPTRYYVQLDTEQFWIGWLAAKRHAAKGVG